MGAPVLGGGVSGGAASGMASTSDAGGGSAGRWLPGSVRCASVQTENGRGFFQSVRRASSGRRG